MAGRSHNKITKSIKSPPLPFSPPLWLLCAYKYRNNGIVEQIYTLDVSQMVDYCFYNAPSTICCAFGIKLQLAHNKRLCSTLKAIMFDSAKRTGGIRKWFYYLNILFLLYL